MRFSAALFILQAALFLTLFGVISKPRELRGVFVDLNVCDGPGQSYIFDWIKNFKEFPPAQELASWSIDKVMKQMTSGGHSGN